jgi:small subunit ribosomal protein S9
MPACADAVALSQDPDSGYGLPPLQDILRGDDEEAEERAARRESEEAMQKEIAESRVRKVDSQGRAYATGKRKTAIARVWLAPGDGVVTVNGRSLDAYFPDINWRTHVVYPFVVTDTLLMFDVNVMVQGGGPSGQAQAVRHGVAKALQAYDPDWRPALRDHGLITRDPRAVERKKPGRAKARKSFQWVKR